MQPTSGQPPTAPPVDSSTLDQIDAELQGYHASKPFTYGGHVYVLRTTDPSEARWAVQAYGSEVQASAAIGARTGTLAVALVSIDDKPVEAMFAVDPDLVKGLLRSGMQLADATVLARRMAVAAWLDNPKKHPSFIEALYGFWVEEVDRPRREALANLDPRRATTRTGGSSGS